MRVSEDYDDSEYSKRSYFEEFQYGSNMSQTTTNNVAGVAMTCGYLAMVT